MSSKPIAWYLMMSSGRFKPKGIIGKASNCLMLFLSIISKVVTTLTALAICCALVVVVDVFVFALGWTGVDVAELAGVGAPEPAELVGDASTLEPAGIASGVEALVTLDVGDAIAVLVVATAGEDTTFVGFSGLTGLTGDCTFVGFVTLLTQVFEVVVHAPDQIGDP